MEWGGQYGAVEDVASAPYLVLNTRETMQLAEVQQRCTEQLREISPANRRTAERLTWSDWLRTNSLCERNEFVDRMGWAWLLEHCPGVQKKASERNKITWLLPGESLGALTMNFDCERKMNDLSLVEHFGYAKRNVSPDAGHGLSAGPIEQNLGDW